MRAHALTDRLSERDALGRLIEAVRAGESQALVVRGEAGIGKTVPLDYLARQASDSGCRVARAVGVQSEMELAFAGLHQLCAPMLDHLDHLPAPQRDALRIAFGLATGPAPDRFFVGLAVLSLLSEVAGDCPLVCLVDDEQWLDRASAQALGFAARRLAADPVGLVFAAREPGQDLTRLPELGMGGLGEEDARVLLDSAQLRAPHDMLAATGMAAFAERARRELLATVSTPRKRSVETRDELTAQEEQIARLARDGLSNPEIGARLFLSPRTVEWHLRKVFTKLGIGSRHELKAALASLGQDG